MLWSIQREMGVCGRGNLWISLPEFLGNREYWLTSSMYALRVWVPTTMLRFISPSTSWVKYTIMVSVWLSTRYDSSVMSMPSFSINWMKYCVGSKHPHSFFFFFLRVWVFCVLSPQKADGILEKIPDSRYKQQKVNFFTNRGTFK